MTVSTSIQVGASQMPAIGLGLWKIARDVTAETVVKAISTGYRHLDCAADYGNEPEVGLGIRQAIAQGLVRREELWVTSKLWNTFHRKEHVRAACERSLSDLGLDYLDLYLVHFPIALKYVDFATRYPPEWIHDPTAKHPRMEPDAVPLHETWAAMEDLVTAGLVREIGVCNYNTGLVHDLMATARIRPAMLQIEAHPFLTQDRLLRLAQGYGLAVTAFSPLGALSYLELGMADVNDSVLEQPVVKAAAARLGRSAAQVVLRWALQRGTAIIPKTSRPERLGENLALFDFSLTEEEMRDFGKLNRNRRFNDPAVFCDQAFGCFYPIYD
ncbi:MAG: aldo/keto reductase [Steroidobacteraceae bacterium]